MNDYINDLIDRWDLHPYVWNLLLVLFSIVIGLLFSFILSLFIKKQKGTATKFILIQSLLKHLLKPIIFWMPIFVFDALLPALQISDVFRIRLDHAAEVALILTTAWIFIRLINVAQDLVHYKVNIHTADNLRQRRLLTQLMYIRRVLTVLIIIIAIGAILLTFDTMRKVGTGLLTGVGIGGIIIGFAAQRSLGNLLAGFQIAFTQPIRIEDEVIVEGKFGVVEELTLTYVVIKLWDEKRLILPINYFIEKPFENWTRNSSQLMGSVFIYTDYDLPVEWLRKEFLKLVSDHPLWDKRVASLVVTDIKESTMEIRGVISGKKSGDVFDLRCYLREQLVNIIKETYPSSLPKARVILDRTE